jgi:alanine dehydrogenase
MIPLRILSDDDIRNILDIKNTITFVENAYVLKATNQARLFPIVSEDVIQGRAEMDIKSGVLNGEDIFGLKLVSWFGDNVKRGLPAITGLTMIFDLKNGFPKALLNARYLTGMRTGAAGAVGVKYLAKPDSKVLLLVGTGAQAVFQIAATLSEVQTISKIYLFNPLSLEMAIEFQASIKTELGRILNDINDPENIKWLQRIEAVEFIAVDDVVSALKETDVVITATPSREPILLKEWIKPGTHFSCMGADVSGKQEIDENIFSEATIFVDDIVQASTVGETQSAVRSGVIQRTDLTEIGHLISGNAKGRRSESDITIFDSTGIALQDLAVSKYLLVKAEEVNLGSIAQI